MLVSHVSLSGFLLGAALCTASVMASYSPSDADPLKTFIDGPILFRDEVGHEVQTPYDPAIIEQILEGKVFDYDTRLYKRDVDVLINPPADHDLVTFSVRLGSSYQPPMRLRLDFNYDGYDLKEEIALPQHRGTMDHRLIIQRKFPNRGARLNALRSGMSDPPTESMIDANLRLIEGLANDPVEETTVTARQRYEDYNWAIELVKTIMRSGTDLSPSVSLRLMDLPSYHSFAALDTQQQFQVHAGFARWFAQSKTPSQQILSTLTHAGMARSFYEDAYLLAEEANASAAPIPAKDLIRALQEWYRFECDTAKGTEGWLELCLFTIYDAGSFDRKFDARTYRSILSDFATILEIHSRPEGGAATECLYRKAVTETRGDMRIFWELYVDLGTQIAEKRRRMGLTLNSTGPYDGKDYPAKMLERGRDILALSDGAPAVSRTCGTI